MEENRIVESDHVSEKVWNEAVQNAGYNGTLFQSTYWAEYARQVHGDRPIYLFATDKKGNITGLLLAIQSCYGKFPVFNWGRSESPIGTVIRKLYKNVLERAFEGILPFCYWQNGPVIIPQFQPENDSGIPRRTYCGLIKKILNIANARNFYAINSARPAYFMDHPELMSSYGFEKRRVGTVLVDVGQSVESIWRHMNKKNRNCIRKSEKLLTFSEVRKFSELKSFYSIYVQSIKRQKAKPYAFSYFESLWNFFARTGKIAVFNAYFRDKPVATSMCLTYNNIIHVVIDGDSDFARSNKMHANDFMHWHIIKWANNRGFRYLDLSGSFLYKIEAGDEKALSLFKYKLKWGKNIEFNDYWKLTDRSFLRLRAKSAKILNLFLPESGGCGVY